MNPSPQDAYSLRRLNPFNGTLQVVATQAARALSADGSRWEIQVWSRQPLGLWANTPLGDKRFFRFGCWSQAHGLEQVPVNPLFDVDEMLSASDALISLLQSKLSQVPFAPADNHELWSLDRDDLRPVALLNSARSKDEFKLKDTACWSGSADGQQPRQLDEAAYTALEQQVRARSGPQQLRAWIQRLDMGDGVVLDGSQRRLELDDFPEMTLTLSGWQTDAKQLVMDYIRWKSPQLLQLHSLSDETRDWLEKQAAPQPREIDRYWRLYPHIHDNQLLNNARVKAKIQHSTQK